MRYELKRIEIWPMIRVVIIFSLVFGFFISIFYAFLFSMISRFSVPIESFGGEGISSLAGAGMVVIVIFVTLFVTFINVVLTALFAAAYNLLAGSIGGLVFDWEPKK